MQKKKYLITDPPPPLLINSMINLLKSLGLVNDLDHRAAEVIVLNKSEGSLVGE